MGTSSLPLHLLFWLCVVAQSSLPCACAPIFRRDVIQRDHVITTSHDRNAVASRKDFIVQVPDSDVVPELTETVDDNPAHTVKQPGDGVKNNNNMRKARFPASDVSAFLDGINVAIGVIEGVYKDRQPEHDEIKEIVDVTLRPVSWHDSSQIRPIRATSVSAKSSTFNGAMFLRFMMFFGFVWAIIIPIVIFEFVMMYAFRKSEGWLIKKHYIVNDV